MVNDEESGPPIFGNDEIFLSFLRDDRWRVIDSNEKDSIDERSYLRQSAAVGSKRRSLGSACWTFFSRITYCFDFCYLRTRDGWIPPTLEREIKVLLPFEYVLTSI